MARRLRRGDHYGGSGRYDALFESSSGTSAVMVTGLRHFADLELDIDDRVLAGRERHALPNGFLETRCCPP